MAPRLAILFYSIGCVSEQGFADVGMYIYVRCPHVGW